RDGKVYVRNQRVKPLKRYTGSNLADMGRGAVPTHLVVSDSVVRRSRGQGGHEECLRRTRGDAAGAKLGTDPDDRDMVNVGSAPAPFRRPTCQVGGGQVRRPPAGPGRGGAAVVLRGRESRPVGEGRQ